MLLTTRVGFEINETVIQIPYKSAKKFLKFVSTLEPHGLNENETITGKCVEISFKPFVNGKRAVISNRIVETNETFEIEFTIAEISNLANFCVEILSEMFVKHSCCVTTQ